MPRLMLTVEFASQGFDVVQAGTPREVQVAAAAEGELAAVVLDVNLGAGPNGYELAEQIRERRPSVPILFISGDDAAPHVARSLGRAGVLAKPFAAGQARAALAALLGGATAEDPADRGP